jgi:hypothetical protein
MRFKVNDGTLILSRFFINLGVYSLHNEGLIVSLSSFKQFSTVMRKYIQNRTIGPIYYNKLSEKASQVHCNIQHVTHHFTLIAHTTSTKNF